MGFSSSSFATISSDLNSAITWLRDLGINLAGTRLSDYERTTNRLLEIYETRNYDAASNEFEQIAVSLFEITDFISIHKSLAGLYDTELKEKYRKYSTGPYDYRDENLSSASNAARNIGFELVIASKLVDAKLPIIFGTSSDVTTKFNGLEILIECKRPQSRNKIEKRYKEGSKQLKKKLAGAANFNRRGIVALNSTKTMNKDFQLLIAQNEQEVASNAGQIIDIFLDQYKSIWIKNYHKRNIAIFIRFAFLSVIKSRGNMLTFSQKIGIVQNPNVKTTDVKLAEELAKRLQLIQ